MGKVDVHVLHMPNEINIIGPLDSDDIVVHHTDGIHMDTMTARLNGFSLGNEKYISFVDPDDEVELGAFSKCIKALEENPELGGVYTNSMIIPHNRKGILKVYYKPHTWTIKWHIDIICNKAPTPIHQIAVMRRSVFDMVLQSIIDCIPGFTEKRIALCEQIIYSHVARVAPWKFLDIIGYYWHKREHSNHTKYTVKNTMEAIEYIVSILK